MKDEDSFYLIFILTVLITRLSIYLVPNKDVVLFGMIIHHFWFGFLIFLISLFLKQKWDLLFVAAVGLGLMADELIFMILGAGSDVEYWSKAVIFGTCLTLLVIYLTRKKISKKFRK